MVHNLHPKTVWGINSSFWTVGVEVQLYLLYPILIWVAARYGWRRSLWLAGTCEVLICASKALGFGDVGHLGHTPLAFWLSWTLGAALAENYLQNKPPLLARWPTSLFVGLLLLCFVVRDLVPFIFLAAALVTTNVMGRLLAKEKAGTLIIPGWLEPLRQLGIYSYSLYLLHQPLMYAIRANLSQFIDLEKHPFVQFGLSMSTMVFIFPISFLFYKVFEQPSITLGKRVLRALEDGSKKMTPVKVG
jgi:peptidoglycan/LPS O-acetylase OafA/YrhL